MILREYAEKCKLDVFLHACRAFYVGSKAKNSSAKDVNEICKSLAGLKQLYYDKVRQVSDTPDILFGKFVNIALSLMNDATLWSITLCSQFVNSLVVGLKDEMEALHFRMPSLSGQDTKKLQLTALSLTSCNAVNYNFFVSWPLRDGILKCNASISCLRSTANELTNWEQILMLHNSLCG